MSELDYKKVKSRYYPYVKLNAGYGYTANWTEVGNYDLQQRLGLNYGVTIGMSLFDGFNRKREQRNARIQIQAQNSLLEAEERLSVAEYSTKICEISLLQLSGQILTYIRPEPEKASF